MTEEALAAVEELIRLVYHDHLNNGDILSNNTVTMAAHVSWLMKTEEAQLNERKARPTPPAGDQPA